MASVIVRRCCHSLRALLRSLPADTVVTYCCCYGVLRLPLLLTTACCYGYCALDLSTASLLLVLPSACGYCLLLLPAAAASIASLSVTVVA